MADQIIRDVSDTALWVAYYRAVESERPDALFKDPLAKTLIGERGESIARTMDRTAMYTQQNVVIRTYIIDGFIKNLVASGIDTIVNLGAGLDTRPYRLDLPLTTRWIEVDYPHIIDLKNERLKSQTPRVQLERIPLDLADRTGRQTLFARIAADSKRVAILTEGVLVYLTEDQVSTLSEDLAAQSRFEFWITEYIAKETYRYLRDPKRMERLKNAPFQFYPEDWFGFFKQRGWIVDQIQYIQETTHRLHRPTPMPVFAKLIMPFIPKAKKEQFAKMSGYMILKRA